MSTFNFEALAMRRTVLRRLPRLFVATLAAAPAALSAPLHAQTAPTPVGTWHTVDENTGERRNQPILGIEARTMSPRHPRHRVALLTGASSGIGDALPAALAAQGTHVLLTARSVPRLERMWRSV